MEAALVEFPYEEENAGQRGVLIIYIEQILLKWDCKKGCELSMVSMRSLLAYFWVDKPRVIYFVACCLVVLLLAWKGKDRFATKVFRYIVLPSMVLLVILLNPLTAHLLVTKYQETRSLRFFWLIPVSLLLALVTVRLVSSLRKRKLKILVAIIVPVILLLFSDGFEKLRGTWQNRITNWYKVPPIVIALDDWIMQDDSALKKSAVFPHPLNLWVRQYRPEIELPFEWHRINTKSEAAMALYDIIQGTQNEGGVIDLCQVEYWAQKGGYNYIVLDSDGQYKGSLNIYEEVYRVDLEPLRDGNAYEREYVLYRLAE